MDLELADKVFLVTGGSDGLGKALCKRLVREGANVALCSRDEEKLKAAEAFIDPAKKRVLAQRADVSSTRDLEAFVEAVKKRWGRIDGVVNNAGKASAMALGDITDEAWDEDLQLKLYGAARLIRLVLPELKVSRGSIVNVLAISAKTPGANSAPSSVSRAAGLALTKALSKELGADGIRANAVLIGFIESGQWERMANRGGTKLQDFYAKMAKEMGVPLGRVGKDSEFADMVCFLLSARASYVSGTAINIDGGLCAAV